VALSRPVYPTRDARAARSELAVEIGYQVDQANQLAARSGADLSLGVDEYLASGVFHMGSVDEVIESLSADPAVAASDELICQFGSVGPGRDNALRGLELLATKVAPALGWRPRRDAGVSAAD
jgi:hypothetical protein